MKKRKLLSWALTSAMVLSMSPLAVWAQGENEQPYDLEGSLEDSLVINRDLIISSGLSLENHNLVVNGDVYLAGNLDCGTGTMIVHGTVYHTKGKLNINQGRLDVDEDYKLVSAQTNSETGEVTPAASPGYVQMTEEEGYFCVGGDYLDWSSRGESGYNTFYAGTLELKGDFTQKGQEKCFNGYGSHQVLFTGTETQTVYFENDSNGFYTVGASTNPLVEIQSGRITKLTANVTVQNFSQYGSLDLNGYTLTVKKNFTQTGSVKGSAGKLTVAGNYIQPSGKLAVECARKVLESADQMADRMERYRRSLTTLIVGSCAPGPTFTLIPRLTSLHPEMTISSALHPEDTLREGLLNDAFQLIVLSRPCADQRSGRAHHAAVLRARRLAGIARQPDERCSLHRAERPENPA